MVILTESEFNKQEKIFNEYFELASKSRKEHKKCQDRLKFLLQQLRDPNFDSNKVCLWAITRNKPESERVFPVIMQI